MMNSSVVRHTTIDIVVEFSYIAGYDCIKAFLTGNLIIWEVSYENRYKTEGIKKYHEKSTGL